MKRIECQSGFIDSMVWHTGRHLALEPNGHFNLRVNGQEELQHFLNILMDGGKWEYHRARVDIIVGEELIYFQYADTVYPPRQTITMTKAQRASLANQVLEAMAQEI